MMSLMIAYSLAYLMIIKVDSLADFIRERGNDAIDLFLQAVSEKLKKSVEQHQEGLMKSYRFYSGEFAILVNNSNVGQIELIAKALSSDLA